MEQVANVQGNPQTSLRAMLGMTGTAGKAAGQMGDGFDMIFQQMMAGGEDGDLTAMLMQLTGGLQKDSEKWGAQMAAEMLNSCPTLNPNVMMALVEASWSADQQSAEAMATQLQALSGLSGDPMAEDGLRGITQALAELVMPEGENAEEAAPAQNQDFLEMLSAAWDQKPKETPRTAATLLDHNSIRAAKELMQRDKKETVTPPLDIESLQADVDSRRFVPVSANPLTEQPQVPDGEELARQVKDSIFENVSQGRNEFVVRLKPEGIGEIVVKLSEDKEKISLSIFTSSEQTARLISGEVAALQNALKPLNAEVQEITTVAANEQAAQYSAQNEMTDQGRQSHGQQEPGQSRRAVRGVGGIREDEFDDTVEAGLAANDEVLDTYI